MDTRTKEDLVVLQRITELAEKLEVPLWKLTAANRLGRIDIAISAALEVNRIITNHAHTYDPH